MVKGSEDHFIPWSYVTAKLNAGLRVLSWYSHPYTPPLCQGDTSGAASCAYPGFNTIQIVNGLQLPDGSYSWCGHGAASNSGNHAKIGIGINSNWVVFGDMNMQGTINSYCDSSQMGRGGGFYAIQNQTLWNGFNKVFSSHCQCDDSTSNCAACSS